MLRLRLMATWLLVSSYCLAMVIETSPSAVIYISEDIAVPFTSNIQTDTPLTYSDGGLTRPVPPGTNCVDSNGKVTFEHANAAGNPIPGGEASPTAGRLDVPTVATTAVVETAAAGAPTQAAATDPGEVTSDGAVMATAASVGRVVATGVTVQSNPTGTVAASNSSGGGLVEGAAGQLVLGLSPTGTAACPADPVSVTATVPAPLTKIRNKDGKRFVAYWSAWHGTGKGINPDKTHLKGITHLILSFWDPNTMNSFSPSSNTEWTKDTADELRAINPDMKVMAAFGGWALDEFFRFNATDQYRDALADVFVAFVLDYGLDGVDVDWEYPVNNGATYQTTRPEGKCDKMNNVLLMQSIRNKLEEAKSKPSGKKEYVLSLAVPAKPGDVAAYDTESAPLIDKVVDFWNLMSYDFMNRRDEALIHHAGAKVIEDTVKLYTAMGLDGEKLNIGFPLYTKFFKLPAGANCDAKNPIGCKVPPNAWEGAGGGDEGTSGAIMFNEKLNSAESIGTDNFAILTPALTEWEKVKAAPISDEKAGASAGLSNGYFFTWVTGKDITASCSKHLKGVGGIMAWSIDQDDKGASGGEHFDAMAKCVS